ncbi:MAG: hypothetical protein ACREMU_00295 [Gemmatimonadaceae bacterium]
MRRRLLLLLAVALLGCTRESALVSGSTDSYAFAERVRGAIAAGIADSAAERALTTRGFDCVRSDTLQSDEGDTLEASPSADDPGTEFLTCQYVRARRWGQSTRRRYLVVLYLREHRVHRVYAVTHLVEVH